MLGLLVHAVDRDDVAMVTAIASILEHPPAEPEADRPSNRQPSEILRLAVDDAEWVWRAALGNLAQRGGRENAIYHRLARVRLMKRGDLV